MRRISRLSSAVHFYLESNGFFINAGIPILIHQSSQLDANQLQVNYPDPWQQALSIGPLPYAMKWSAHEGRFELLKVLEDTTLYRQVVDAAEPIYQQFDRENRITHLPVYGPRMPIYMIQRFSISLHGCRWIK